MTTLDLHYRSASGFLLAYASQLAAGELFLETASPWPLATPLQLRVHVGGGGGATEAAARIPLFELSATVAWTRPVPMGPGQPAGMGLSLLSALDAGGARIDALVGQYTRTKIWVATADSAGRAILSRYLQSLMTCDLVDGPPFEERLDDLAGTPSPVGVRNDPDTLEMSLPAIDLAVIDFDAPGVASTASLVRALRARDVSRGVPIVVLAQAERDRTRAATLGVDEILPNPPSLPELQSAVIHVLSRPTIWTAAPPP